MHRLFMLRHAKSSWTDPALEDFDRPLNERGFRTSVLMGAHMVENGLIPDKILCSTAFRTRGTLAILLHSFGNNLTMELRSELYSGDTQDYLDIIAEHGDSAENLLVIAHNPCIQEATLGLSNDENHENHRRVAEHFPTAGLAIVEFEHSNWKEMKSGSGTISEFYRPKELSF